VAVPHLQHNNSPTQRPSRSSRGILVSRVFIARGGILIEASVSTSLSVHLLLHSITHFDRCTWRNLRWVNGGNSYYNIVCERVHVKCLEANIIVISTLYKIFELNV